MAVLYYKALTFINFVNYLKFVILGVELLDQHLCYHGSALHAVHKEYLKFDKIKGHYFLYYFMRY